MAFVTSKLHLLHVLARACLRVCTLSPNMLIGSSTTKCKWRKTDCMRTLELNTKVICQSSNCVCMCVPSMSPWEIVYMSAGICAYGLINLNPNSFMSLITHLWRYDGIISTTTTRIGTPTTVKSWIPKHVVQNFAHALQSSRCPHETIVFDYIYHNLELAEFVHKNICMKTMGRIMHTGAYVHIWQCAHSIALIFHKLTSFLPNTNLNIVV